MINRLFGRLSKAAYLTGLRAGAAFPVPGHAGPTGTGVDCVAAVINVR